MVTFSTLWCSGSQTFSVQGALSVSATGLGRRRAKQMPNTSVYSVVRSKNVITIFPEKKKFVAVWKNNTHKLEGKQYFEIPCGAPGGRGEQFGNHRCSTWNTNIGLNQNMISKNLLQLTVSQSPRNGLTY